MPQLSMMIGVSGAGKSSCVESIVDGDIILSTDRWLEEYAKLNDLTYNEAFQMKYKESEMALRQDLAFAIRHGQNIIWDQTNLTKKTRKRKLAMIPKEYRKVAILINTPPEIIHESNNSGRGLPNHVINDMIMRLEPPTEDEGFSKIVVIERVK